MTNIAEEWLDEIAETPMFKMFLTSMSKVIDEWSDEEAKKLMREYSLTYVEAKYIVLCKLREAWSDDDD